MLCRLPSAMLTPSLCVRVRVCPCASALEQAAVQATPSLAAGSDAGVSFIRHVQSLSTRMMSSDGVEDVDGLQDMAEALTGVLFSAYPALWPPTA